MGTLQAVAVLVLLYGCKIFFSCPKIGKQFDENHGRMLHAVLDKSWTQHPTRLQLPPISQTIQVKRAKHAGHFRRSKDDIISDVL